MALTSRINIAIGIDTLGHSKFYENLFHAMKFQHTELTCSGLQRMLRKKEYGRIYFGLRKVKLRRWIKQCDSMVEGTKKLKEDAEEGMEYSSGLRLQKENDETEEESEQPKKKRAKGTHDNNNKPTRKSKEECKCGGKDHKHTTSSKCPWQRLLPVEVSENYGKLLEKRVREQSCQPTINEPTENTVEVIAEEVTEEGEMRRKINGNVQSTSTLVLGAKNDTVGAKNGANVQATSSWLARRTRIVLRHRTTCNSPGTLSTGECTVGNPKGL
jgi:hypothetical protein